MRFLSLVSCFLLVSIGGLVARAQNGAQVFRGSTQMLVVTTSGWDAVDGRLQRFERTTTRAVWHAVGKPIPIVVGKSGLGWGIGVTAIHDADVRLGSDPVKKEGDGKSPAGVFALGMAFGDAAQPLPGLKMPYLTLSPSIECVDDVHSKYYNRVLDRTKVAADWKSSEHMRDVGEAYRWGMVIDHNGTVVESGAKPPMPGGGSCVFLHIWGGSGHGTAGCTAMAESNVMALLPWLDPKRRPLLVQMPTPEYERLAKHWHLPAFAAEVAQ